MTKEEELTRDGWEKQTTYDEPRLSELVELYEEMDVEVLVVPFDPDSEPGCVECMKVSKEKYKTIFTRKKTL